MWFQNSQNKLKALITVEVILIGVILFSSFSLIRAGWQKIPSVQTPETLLTETPLPITQKLPGTSAPPSPTATLESVQPTQTPTPLPSPTFNPDTMCGGPPNLLILALGIDTRWNSYYYGLADVIRIVRVDFVTGGVTILTLPRDLWVEIPGLEDHNITHGKLNQAYYYGSEYLGYYDGPDLGPGLMLKTLALNYDLDISKYITLNMITVEKVINAAGGIDIYLPYDVDGVSVDPPVDLGFFEKGLHHFNGEEAVRFSRVRMIDNDLQRSVRQSWVLEALWKKLMSPAILPRIPELVQALYGSVETNLGAGDIRQLICLAPLVAEQKINFVSLPADMLVADRIYAERLLKTLFYWKVDLDELVALLADFQAGTWPPAEQP